MPIITTSDIKRQDTFFKKHTDCDSRAKSVTYNDGMKRADEIGCRVRKLRLVRGYTQATVAGMAGVVPSMITMIEKGDRLPGIDVLDAIAVALGVTSGFLLGEGLPLKKELLDFLQELEGPGLCLSLARLNAFQREQVARLIMALFSPVAGQRGAVNGL